MHVTKTKKQMILIMLGTQKKKKNTNYTSTNAVIVPTSKISASSFISEKLTQLGQGLS